MAEKYHISTTPLTRQLPSIILFQDGKETGRVPAIISGQIQKFTFKEEEIINTFDLNRCEYFPLYREILDRKS